MHKIEAGILKSLPGEELLYASWKELDLALNSIFKGIKRLALNYSPNNEIPYLSKVDAGTVEKLRNFGLEIKSSAELAQEFQSVISESGYQSHISAGKKIIPLIYETFEYLQQQLKHKIEVNEYQIQSFMWQRYHELNLTSYHPPIIACNENSANPHYCPTAESSKIIKSGDFVLIDTWAKENTSDSIYFDVTWVAVMNQKPTLEHQNVFEIVKNARNAATSYIQTNYQKQTLRGCDVDDLTRKVISDAGFADYFIHRTGHSIHTETHGGGANIDNFETHDTRNLIPHTCFSIEPGIYLPGKFGVRSEINIFLHADHAEVTVAEGQKEILCYPI
jgi:Xaa-Pro aminopeptidase